MKVRKYQWAGNIMPSDNTRVTRPPQDFTIQYKLKPGEHFFKDNRTGKVHVVSPQNTQVSQDKRTKKQRKADQAWAEKKKELIRLQQAQEETAAVANAILERTMPSYYIEKATGEDLGMVGRLAADLIAPSAAIKGLLLLGKSAKYVGKGIDYLARMDMTRYGYKPTTRYYFKPGYAGLNGGVVGRFEEIKPKFNYRKANIPEQAEYIIENPNAEITHPILTRSIANNPETQRYVERLKTGEETIPIFTYPNGRLIPLIESATGENVSLGTLISAKEAEINTPHVVTLTGMRPILKENGAITEASGLEDFVTRNGFNFSTNSRANATEYAWLGDARENIQRLANLGFMEGGEANKYYTELHKLIDDLNKKYGVKNYAYPNTVNTDLLPLYRGTGNPVNFSLQTHLFKKPNGVKVIWDPEERAVYDEAMDLLSQFWGENLNGGGVRETLIPRRIGLNVGSTKPMDYRLMIEHSVIGPDAVRLKISHLPKRYKGYVEGELKNKPLNTMDALEEWAKLNKILSFQVGPINDPLPSISHANRTGTFYFSKKQGGKIQCLKNSKSI